MEYVLLRFTGVRIGSMNYRSGGKPVAFGQNRSHFQQLVTPHQRNALMLNYPKEFVQLPLDKMRIEVPVQTPIKTCDIPGFTEKHKKKLISSYQTIGEILSDQGSVLSLLGTKEGKKVINAIREYLSLPLIPVMPDEVDEPVSELVE